MKREIKKMKEAYNCRIRDIERISNEMLDQKDRLSTIIKHQKQPPSIATNAIASYSHHLEAAAKTLTSSSLYDSGTQPRLEDETNTRG